MIVSNSVWNMTFDCSKLQPVSNVFEFSRRPHFPPPESGLVLEGEPLRLVVAPARLLVDLREPGAADILFLEHDSTLEPACKVSVLSKEN